MGVDSCNFLPPVLEGPPTPMVGLGGLGGYSRQEKREKPERQAEDVLDAIHFGFVAISN